MLRTFIKNALLTWIITNVAGTSILTFSPVIGLKFIELLALSLIFSIPAPIVMIPSFGLFASLKSKFTRLLWSAASVFIACLTVISIFYLLLGSFAVLTESIINILWPYVACAPVVFVLVNWKIIFNKSIQLVV